MTYKDVIECYELLSEWRTENRDTNTIDYEKLLIISDGFEKCWNDVCEKRQLSLDVLKDDKLQNELDNEIENYNKLDIPERLLHNIRWFKIFFKKEKIIKELFTFDGIYKLSIPEIEESIAKGKVIVALHEFKFSNSNIPMYKDYIKLMEKVLNLKKISTQPTAVDSKSNNKKQILFEALFDLGFWNLAKTKNLSSDGQSKLIELLSYNDTPYIVAMFEFLNFFRHLTIELGYTNTKIHSKLSAIFEIDKQTFKCNMLVLNEASSLRENNRYTAHLHKEKVKTDYYSLK